jgi:hypothetical protein
VLALLALAAMIFWCGRRSHADASAASADADAVGPVASSVGMSPQLTSTVMTLDSYSRYSEQPVGMAKHEYSPETQYAKMNNAYPPGYGGRQQVNEDYI